MKSDQHRIHHQGCKDRLDNTDHRGCLAGVLELRQPELVSDVKCNKAQSHIAQHTDTLDIFHCIKTDAMNTKASECIRANQYAGDQERRNVRKVQFQVLEHTGHHQACKKSQCSFQ